MMEVKNVNASYILTWICMFMQSPAAVARKLLVDEKITACVKQNVSGVLYLKFQIEKNSLVKHSAFLKKICTQHK